MPTRQAGDFTLNGKPYRLARVQGARSWHRTGQPDTPGRRSQTDVQYGQLPSEIEHVEVWDDWSGGFGYAYREPERLNTYHWAKFMDARFSRQLVHCQAITAVNTSGPETMLDVPAIGVAADHNQPGRGTVAILQNNYLKWIRPKLSLSYVSQLSSFFDGVSPTRRAAVWGSYIYAGVLQATQFLQIDLNGSLVANTHGMPGRIFAKAGNRLWRAYGPTADERRYIRSVALGSDPTLTANWSAELAIGNGQTQINDMIELNDQLFLGCNDGLYAGDQSGTFYNVLSEIAAQPHAENGQQLAVHNGGIIFTHLGGIYKYTPSSTEARAVEIGPRSRNIRSPVAGRPTAIAAWGPWLLAAVMGSTQNYLFCGVEDQSRGEYVWHTQQNKSESYLLIRQPIHWLHIDAITTSSGGASQLPQRVHAIMSDRTDSNDLGKWLLFESPPVYGNPLIPSTVFTPNYNGSARIDLGRTNWGAPATPKQLRSVEVWADNLLSGIRYADVYYELDALPRTLLGRAQTSPRSVLYWSANANASLFTGQSVALSLESFTASASETPVYRAIVLRGATRPRSADLITAQVQVADHLRDRQQQPMRPGAVMLQELHSLASQAAPVQLIDLTGAAHWVNVLPPVEEQEVWQRGDESPEVVAAVRMAVLEYS